MAIPSLPYGEYRLTVSFLGYETITKRTFRGWSAGKQNIGRIELQARRADRDGRSRRPKALRTSQKGDTVSYNAGAFKVTG